MRIVHEPTGVEAHAGERRSASENKREAVWRLRLALAIVVRCPVRDGDARSALWESRCTGGRIRVSPTHDDYPALLAEALDTLWMGGLEMQPAAARLECSASQLLGLIKDHAPAWVWLNAQRASRGMHPLR